MPMFKGAKGRTPAERITELARARRKHVFNKPFVNIFRDFAAKIEQISKTNITGGSLTAKTGSYPYCRVILSGKSLELASAQAKIERHEGKLELLIENIQGCTPFKEEYKQFMNENKNVPWNFALVRSMVSAAYKSGFDRVLFVDITSTNSYKYPVVHKDIRKDTVRQIMKQLYEKTRDACDFDSTKEEWREERNPAYPKTHYWVREFP